MDINWNNFRFIIKRNQIDEIYVDDYYMDINKLQRYPIWDRYHNLTYWLDKYSDVVFEITKNRKTINYILYEEIRNYINDNIVNKRKINLEV